MSTVLGGLLVVLVGTLVVGMWRVQRGPSAADRMLSALLIGATTVAILLVLAEWQQQPALRVATLLVVMLAAVAAVTFAAIGQSAPDADPAVDHEGERS